MSVTPYPAFVTPAEAGVQGNRFCAGPRDSRPRGNDG
jgi:hypothetical protein